MSDSVWTWLYYFLEDLYDGDQDEIAEKIEDFSSLAYAKDQDSVEAVYPELLAYARAHENKWLEIFIRHWRLQAYVGTNSDQRKLVPEALDLLAFSQSDDTRDCPQSTCIVDDLAAIYSSIDAPGFAPELLEMLEDAMQGLSPKVECFQCMTMCLVDTWVDLGEPEKALEIWKQGDRENPDFFREQHFYRYLATSVAHALIDAGRYKIAADMLDKCEPVDDIGRSEVKALKIRTLLHERKSEDAAKLVMEILDISAADVDAAQFVRAARSFDSLPAPDRVASHALLIAQHCENTGCVREAFDSASLAFDLATEQNDKKLATDALAIMETVIGDLNRPLGADKVLAAAKAV